VADSPAVCYLTDSSPTTGASDAYDWKVDKKPITHGCVMDNPPCQKIYGFTSAQMRELNSDPLMYKLLTKPNIAIDLLYALAQWTKRTNNLYNVSGTHFDTFAKLNRLYD
jgi:hypothetical protein